VRSTSISRTVDPPSPASILRTLHDRLPSSLAARPLPFQTAEEPDGSGSTASERPADDDTAARVLADPQTRFAFYFVRDRAHRPVRFQELGQAMHDRRESLGIDADATRGDVGDALRTHHLPALSRQGLVRVDDDENTVRYLGRDGIDDVLEDHAGFDPNVLWSRT
jgi:hypothetical protein